MLQVRDEPEFYDLEAYIAAQDFDQAELHASSVESPQPLNTMPPAYVPARIGAGSSRSGDRPSGWNRSPTIEEIKNPPTII